MRKLLPGLAAGLSLVLALPGAAQSFRVVTWHSDDFPGTLNSAGTDDPDVKRLRQMANVLKPYNADLILLEGMADRQTSQRLVGMLKPINYTIASFHVFRGGPSNQAVAPSVTILTRKSPLTSRGVEWRTSGQIDTPGGFNFVTVPAGSNVVCFYASRFLDAPAAATNARVAQANTRKRDFAAQYLLHHARWLESSLTNRVGFVIAGNLSSGPESGDTGLRILEQGAFKRADPLAAGEAGLMSAKDWLARNLDFDGALQLGLPRSFSYGPMVCELVFKALPSVASVPAAAPAAAPAAPPAPKSGLGPALSSLDSMFRRISIDERYLWLGVPVVGAVLLLLLLLLPYRWLQARRQDRAELLALRRRTRNAVVVDFAPAPGELGDAPAAGALPGERGSAAWEERAREAEQRASKATAVVREGLMPQLVRLMREKIFQRLSSQRAHLLDSHLNGTMAVLELEERLEKIQSQFASRLAAREQRIAELEAELSAKENIIRELIKAQARLAGRVSNEG